MNRRLAFILILSTFHLGCLLPCAHGQANLPLDVSPNAPQEQPAGASSSPSSKPREKDLKQFAQQMITRPTAQAKLPEEDPARAAITRPGGSTAVSQPALPSSEQTGANPATTPAPPVVVADPIESRPLGMAPAASKPGELSAEPGTGWGATQTILALALVVGLILVGKQLVLRWMGQPAAVNRSRLVEVMSRVSVGPRQHIVILRMGSRILVLADSAGQMRPLANIEEPEEVAAILKSVTASKPASISEGFNQLLGRFDQDFDQAENLRRREEGEDLGESQLDRTRDQLSGLLARVRSMAGNGGAS